MTKTRPLWQWGATDLAAAIAAGTISSRDAVGAALERMAEVNGRINAVVDDMSKEAAAEAAALDETQAREDIVGPLHGVPITIKENIDQAGRATPNGVVAFKDVVASEDSPVVRNLKAAGAVVIGRTNTPEFSMRGTTVNPLHGRTHNPWHAEASAGGSSGGASAAVASGMGALGHGNDILGSLRFPSYACGLATVKPGLGRTPAYNPSAAAERGLMAQLMSVQGLIARRVRDVRLGMRALVRYDAHDPWMVEMPFDGPPVEGPIRVAMTKNAFDFELHPGVDRALDTAHDALADAGYQVETVEPPFIREAALAGARCLLGEMKVMMDPDIRKYGSEEVTRIFDDYYAYFGPFEGDDLLRAMADRNRHCRAWTLFLQDYPLVLTPFMPKPIFTWNRDTQGLDGVGEVLGSALNCFAMNYLGLPAANVPANYADGLPIGVQIVGRRFREDMTLDAAEAIEDRVGVMTDRLWAD